MEAMRVLELLVLVLSSTGYYPARSLPHQLQSPLAYFESRNFHTVLRWQGGDASGDNGSYNVRYTIYGKLWQAKEGCQGITDLSCDLTNEMFNVKQYYHGRLETAHGRQLATTNRFNPLRDTILEAPSVLLRPALTTLDVSVKLPMWPTNRTFLEELHSFECNAPLSVLYTVVLAPADQLVCNSTADPQNYLHINTSEDSEITVNGLKQNTEYCGSVFYTLVYEGKPTDSESQAFRFTVKTHKGSTPHVLLLLFIGPVLIFVLSVAAMLVTVCQLYIRKKSHLPDVLILASNFSSKPRSLFLCEETHITNLEVQTQQENIYAKLQKPCLQRVPQTRGTGRGCASEDWKSTPWSPSSPSSSHQEGSPSGSPGSHRSSVLYSLLAVAESSDGEKEPPQEGPLLLSIRRGVGGLLELSSLIPPLQLQDVPTLSDLIVQGDVESTDSGVEEEDSPRTYLPNHSPSSSYRPPLRPTSTYRPNTCYKQNWMPTQPLVLPKTEDSQDWMTTEPQVWPDEGGGGILLKDWQLQIQS